MKIKMVTIFTMGIIAMLMMPYSLLAVHVNVAVKVVDEGNIPIEQADVEIGFRDMHAKAPGKGWGTGRVDCHPAKGKTDKNGMFSASDNTSPNVVVTVTKPGYYKSTEGVFNEDGVAKEGTLTIVLKKKINPVSMYAKKTNAIKMPAVKQPVGYDIEKGDWVAPFGKGVISDFIFTIDYEIPKNARVAETASLTLIFTNAKDGIQEYNPGKTTQSEYRWPYEAPLDGYLTKIKKHTSLGADRNLKEEANYIFRIRTKTDEKGNIIKAKYGKIQGEIMVGLDGYIGFAFCFNPDGARNLEFDTEKNLFIPEGAKKWKEQYNNFTGFGP